MKEKYELVSQDIIKVQGNGLYVSLVKGRGSQVQYRNPVNGETITLSYNPKAIDVPTIAQRPDNVLTLKKNYLLLKREEDTVFVSKINEMIKSINRRGNSSFMAEVGTYEDSNSMSLVFSMAPG